MMLSGNTTDGHGSCANTMPKSALQGLLKIYIFIHSLSSSSGAAVILGY